MMISEELISPAGGRRATVRLLVVAFTLFASYCLAANVAIALHEFGHALGCWLGGGRVVGLFLAPQGYSGSYAARDFSVEYATRYGRLLQVAGGPVFGAAFGVPFLLAARLFRPGTVGWIAIIAVATWCFGNNGAYLFLGGLVPFGDALDLIEHGVPRWALLVTGLPLVVAFLVLFASFLRGIGLRAKDSYGRWVLTIGAGLLAYLAMIAGARLLWPPDGQLPPTGDDLLGLAVSPLAVLILASGTYPFRRAGHGPATAAEPRWATAGAVLALGVLFIAAEGLFFSNDFEAAAVAATLPRLSTN
jgi:hypothetical protein